jgi:glutaredoxin
MLRILLLSRPCCKPCDGAKFLLKKLKSSGLNFEGKVINIDKHPEYAAFSDKIPVILINDKVFYERNEQQNKLRETDLREAI